MQKHVVLWNEINAQLSAIEKILELKPVNAQRAINHLNILRDLLKELETKSK